MHNDNLPWLEQVPPFYFHDFMERRASRYLEALDDLYRRAKETGMEVRLDSVMQKPFLAYVAAVYGLMCAFNERCLAWAEYLRSRDSEAPLAQEKQYYIGLVRLRSRMLDHVKLASTLLRVERYQIDGSMEIDEVVQMQMPDEILQLAPEASKLELHPSVILKKLCPEAQKDLANLQLELELIPERFVVRENTGSVFGRLIGLLK